MTTMIELGAEINRRLTGGPNCPNSDSLGELALIEPHSTDVYGETVYAAQIYLSDDKFTDAALLASWFTELGATDVFVLHMLHDSVNNTMDGRTLDDQRNWMVLFDFPELTPEDDGQACRVCGCTQNRACGDPTLGTCHWVEPDLCSFCQGEPATDSAALDTSRLSRQSTAHSDEA